MMFLIENGMVHPYDLEGYMNFEKIFDTLVTKDFGNEVELRNKRQRLSKSIQKIYKPN